MAFSCDCCYKTFPDPRNRTPDVDDGDICPNCYEEPEEKETTKIGSREYSW